MESTQPDSLARAVRGVGAKHASDGACTFCVERAEHHGGVGVARRLCGDNGSAISADDFAVPVAHGRLLLQRLLMPVRRGGDVVEVESHGARRRKHRR
jgi:hypothetical protein